MMTNTLTAFLTILIFSQTKICNADGNNKTDVGVCKGLSCKVKGITLMAYNLGKVRNQHGPHYRRRNRTLLVDKYDEEYEKIEKVLIESFSQKRKQVSTLAKRIQKTIKKETKKGKNKVSKLFKLNPKAVNTLSKGTDPAATMGAVKGLIRGGVNEILNLSKQILDGLGTVLKSNSHNMNELADDFAKKVDDYGLNRTKDIKRMKANLAKEKLEILAKKDADIVLEMAKECNDKILQFLSEGAKDVLKTAEKGRVNVKDLGVTNDISMSGLAKQFPTVLKNVVQEDGAYLIELVDDWSGQLQKVATESLKPIHESGQTSGRLIIALGTTRGNMIKLLANGSEEGLPEFEELCKDIRKELKMTNDKGQGHMIKKEEEEVNDFLEAVAKSMKQLSGTNLPARREL